MYFVNIEIDSLNIIFMGDWCFENIDEWSFSISNVEMDILLKHFRSPFKYTEWMDQRWMYRGISRSEKTNVSMKIEDISDAMAFKLRWL